MLVISRKEGQAIIIGENVRLVVVQLKGSQVKLGIDCPPEVRILREEVGQKENVKETV